MRTARWPAIVLVLAAIIAAFIFQQDQPQEPAPSALEPASAFVAPTDARAGLWFCNGGTAVDNGLADHRVVIVNTADGVRSGTMTAFASRTPTAARPAPVKRNFTLAPYGRLEYRLAEVIGQAAFASASVELDGGGVLVEHTISGALGNDRAPCATSASDRWFFPAGTTGTVAAAPSAREVLVFFNPYPGDAVLDVDFSLDTGDRGTPLAFKGLVVPGGSVVGMDLAANNVAVAAQVAAAVTTRSGRVVVDQVQAFDDGPRRGLALTSGSTVASPMWVFSAGRIDDFRKERIVVFNPNTTPAEVDVEVRPQDSSLAVEPFQLTVRPGQYSRVDLDAEPRLSGLAASRAGFAVVVRSADGSSIVAQRLITVPVGSIGAGTALSSPSAVASTRLVADVVDADGANSALVLLNPAVSTIAQLRLVVLAAGAATVPGKYAAVEMQPGARLVVPLVDLGRGTFTVIVESSAPVIGERELFSATTRANAIAVPAGPLRVAFDLFGLSALGS